MRPRKWKPGARAGGRVSGHCASGELDLQLQPTERRIAARHAEIARHYDRVETATAWREVRSNLRMRECRVILRLWTEAGRPIDEITAVIAAGGELGLRGQEIGVVIGFTFADYKNYGAAVGRHPSTIRPVGTGAREIAAYLATVQAPRKAAALRQRRAQKAKMRETASDLDCRASAILTVATDRPEPVTTFMKALARCAAFRTPDGKRFLTGKELRQAITRETKKARLAALIEVTTVVGKYGKATLLIRRISGSATGF
jgi:hypothetical protein